MSATDHLLRLDPAGSVAIWRALVVRSAGFPVALATTLDSQAAVDAALARNDAADRHHRLTEDVREKLRRVSGPTKQAVRKLRGKLGTPGLVQISQALEEPLRSTVAPLLAQEHTLRAADETLRSVHHRELERLTAALQDRVRSGRVREAIVWQSAGALEGVDRFLADGPDQLAHKMGRQRCNLALSYVQRLSVKNDSIGFFGPIAWCTWSEDEADVHFEAREPLVSRHDHYYETWALNNFARRVAQDPALRSHIPLRRLPSISIDGSEIKLPLQPPQSRGEATAVALSMSDGSSSGADVAAELVRRGLTSADEATALLDGLEADGLLFRVPDVPEVFGAESGMLQWIDRAPTERSAPHRHRFDRIESARRGVEAARGNADALREALVEVERVFEAETGAPARRGGGGFYEARAPIFQEAQRNITLRLGRRVIEDLRTPLSLLLRTVHWYTQTIAARVGELAGRLLDKSGSTRLEVLQVFSELMGEFSAVAESVSKETRQRWHEAIAPLAAGGCVEDGAASAAIERCFPRVPVVWEVARHASPDLMLAATDVDAIRRGDYLAVLGEIHVALNTLATALFLCGTDVDEFLEWSRRDVSRTPILGGYVGPGVTVRTSRPYALYGARWYIAHPRNTEWSNANIVPLAALFVERDDRGRVVGRRSDSGESFGIADLCSPALAMVASRAFRITDAAPRLERLQVGRLVIQRAQWNISAGSCAFSTMKEPWERFAAVQAWRRIAGLPRHVFVKVVSENKPIYFDLDSPLFVELLSRLVRNLPEGGVVSISEMLPAPDQLWLRDAEGNAYTSELRCVAVDEG